MDCANFYPVFLLYNGNRLNGFGWNTNGTVDSPRYEHPTKDRFGVSDEYEVYFTHKYLDILDILIYFDYTPPN